MNTLASIMKSAATGNYQPHGDIEAADSILALSFGADKLSHSIVNQLLARYTLNLERPDLSRMLQGEVSDAMPEEEGEPALTIRGEPSTGIGGDLDSWAVLGQAREYMQDNGLERPVLVAQAYHVGRVARQAAKLNIDPIIPPNLPREFDPRSTQRWTRGPRLWTVREWSGMGYLIAKDKL